MKVRWMTGSLLAALTLLLMGLLLSPRPARAATLSAGCSLFESRPNDATMFIFDVFDFNAGETLRVDYSGGISGVISIFNGVSGSGGGPAPDSVSYTFPSSGSFTVNLQGSGVGVYDYSCQAAPVNSGGATGGSLPVPEPFFQNSDPALGVDLDKARLTPDEDGVLPLDVFEPGWWGVKIITAARFPLLAGIDLTTVEVRCLNSRGQWTATHVTLWSSSPTELRVYIRQHGFCGIFPK